MRLRKRSITCDDRRLRGVHRDRLHGVRHDGDDRGARRGCSASSRGRRNSICYAIDSNLGSRSDRLRSNSQGRTRCHSTHRNYSKESREVHPHLHGSWQIKKWLQGKRVKRDFFSSILPKEE
jgi:hypothetical protein